MHIAFALYGSIVYTLGYAVTPTDDFKQAPLRNIVEQNMSFKQTF